jgi:hypothetical protein
MNSYGFRKRITNRVWGSLVSMMMGGVLSSLAPTHALSQTTPNDELTIERPESIDHATWQRLVSGFKKEKQEFVDALQSIDSNRIDYTKDSMTEVIQKQEKLRRLLNKHQVETVRDMARTDLMINYVFMRNETSPRLTGRVIEVGPEEDTTSLDEAIKKARKGDCIRLGKGVFELNDRRRQRQWNKVPTDIAIIGQDRDATEIKMGRGTEIQEAVR